MNEITNKVSLIKKLFNKETDSFLDDMEHYQPPTFEIRFRGESAEIPIDWAELNNSISDFLGRLHDALEEAEL